MKHAILLFLLSILSLSAKTQAFVPEAEMKQDLLQMLADFSLYMQNDWHPCQAPNSLGEECGFFNGENSGGSDERGVRPNADLSMICAFLVKYGKPANVALPEGVTWDRVEEMAMKSLIFAYSTHKANQLKVCSGNRCWGSTSKNDAVWESSLWAMSVAYSAFFQWEKLSDKQRGYIYALLKAECNYELERDIPTGYKGDTKAEENGWEADVLAATLGLFPNDPLAPQWFARLREFAVNSYSHRSDALNTKPIDAEYDALSVADLYKGNNLYDDYTLQNHNLFHTSYQNVVMQELGEAALALQLFQSTEENRNPISPKNPMNNPISPITPTSPRWHTNALMHNNQAVMDSVMNWLALSDGELAMPNGNDWSLFLYDQITSYSTQACFLRDPNALLLENLAYKQIKARQKTTLDGSWLLRADVGARRMGVQAHRVMMTYLMHEALSTADLTPTSWEAFRSTYSAARILPDQNVVRAYTPSRFTCFSWSEGLKSYTGYFAPDCAKENNLIVPYRANNTGNLLGWYEVEGKPTDAQPVVSGVYELDGDAWVMNGELNTNGGTLNNRFALYSTNDNAFIYLDHVTANTDATIAAEKGGLLAISTDEFTSLARTLYYNKKVERLDGTEFTQIQSDWVNIDNQIGVVGKNGKKIAFGDRGANNSIFTSKLYPMYGNERRDVAEGEMVDARNLVYYSNIDASTTQKMSEKLLPLRDYLPEGWNGVIAPDSQGAHILISNFHGTKQQAALQSIEFDGLAPVFRTPTEILNNKSSTTIELAPNHSYAHSLRVFVAGSGLTAQSLDDTTVTMTAYTKTHVKLVISLGGTDNVVKDIVLKPGKTVRAALSGKKIVVTTLKQ